MNKENYSNFVEELVNKGTNNIKDYAVPINGDKPIFTKKDYETIEGEPIYYELDNYGRSNGSIALVSKNTIPLVVKKKLTYPDPYGWTKSLEGKYIFERCHIVAYSLSAKANDKKNIFIGTNTLNTSIMKKFENKVYNHVRDYNVRVLYRVTVKYKGKNQIPTGILIEAQSLDDDFSICEFCYNIQRNVKFKYSDGTIIEDNRGLIEKIKQTAKKTFTIKSANSNKKQNENYVINRKTRVFHLMDKKCSSLKGVESKYINETTATEKNLMNAGLIPCNKCIKNGGKNE